MDAKQYRVIITQTAYMEINKIYNHIKQELYAENAAKGLMRKVEEEVQKLKYAPKIHIEIEKVDEIERNYRKIVIKNFIILYTINEENKVVFIAHMYYGGRDYMYNNLI